MTARTLIVGDVHGCIDELDALLRAARLRPSDRVILVGDLVAKGPASRAVVSRLRHIGAEAVLGNHDAYALGWHAGRETKLDAVTRDEYRAFDADDWSYLRGLPYTLALPEHGVRVVHAGLVPGVAVEAQDPRWLLTLRSIRPDGSPSKRVDDGAPWASVYDGSEFVVFGHDAVRGLQEFPRALGLDSGCVYGGLLTGYLLPERRLLSVPAARPYSAHREPDKANR